MAHHRVMSFGNQSECLGLRFLAQQINCERCNNLIFALGESAHMDLVNTVTIQNCSKADLSHSRLVSTNARDESVCGTQRFFNKLQAHEFLVAQL